MRDVLRKTTVFQGQESVKQIDRLIDFICRVNDTPNARAFNKKLLSLYCGGCTRSFAK